MRICGVIMILGSILLIPYTVNAEPVPKTSIPGEVFFKMFADKTEEELREDTINKMQDIIADYPNTRLARDAAAFVKDQSNKEPNHEWIGKTLNYVKKHLRMNPPDSKNWEIRRSLFLLLDNPLHVETGDEFHRALYNFYRPLLYDVVGEIRRAKLVDGIRIWRIYNMGFVVKTPNHTIAFDLNTRQQDPRFYWMTFLTEKQTNELVELLDVAFISHWHGDHACKEFLDAMNKAGKRVYVPEDPVLYPVFYSEPQENFYPIRGTEPGKPSKYNGIDVYSYAGFQGDAPCNVYVVDVDGYKITQNGDNCTHGIYKEIAAEHNDIDVALVNCWSGTNEFVSAIEPKIYITGHENELMHGISHRISYHNTFGNIDRYGLKYPWDENEPRPVILNSGESIKWSK